MLKLRKILTELLHTYSVEAFIKSNRKTSLDRVVPFGQALDFDKTWADYQRYYNKKKNTASLDLSKKKRPVSSGA